MAEQDEMKINESFFDELSGEKGPETAPEPKGAETQPEEKPQESQPAEEADEKKDEKPAASEFNIKDHFPDYENIDQVKETLEKAKTLPKEEEINDWKDKAAKYSKHNEFIESIRQAGLNKDYLRLNALEAQKSEKSDVYKRLLFGELTDTELVKLDLIDKYPELKENKEMLDFQLEDKYPDIFGDDADPESDEYTKAKKKMQFEATQVNKRLKGEFDSVELPETLDPDHGKKQMQETLEAWKPNFETHEDEIMNIDVEVDGEKHMDIKIPEKEAKQYKDAALMFLAQNNLRYSKESLQQVKDYVKSMYIVKNLETYNKALLDKQAKDLDAKWRKEIHNPEPVDKNKVAPGKTDDFTKFLDELGA